jgi:hypothetical protein
LVCSIFKKTFKKRYNYLKGTSVFTLHFNISCESSGSVVLRVYLQKCVIERHPATYNIATLKPLEEVSVLLA